jgi:hypothetical protein
LPGGAGRVHGDAEHEGRNPLEGSVAQIADVLGRMADEGIAHVQMVLDPITVESVEWFAGVLEHLDA